MSNQGKILELQIGSYTVLIVFDGHGDSGAQVAELFREKMKKYLEEELPRLYEYCEHSFESYKCSFVVDVAKEAYNRSLNDFRCKEKDFKDNGGTTLSCIVYDARKSWATLLQVGNSSILVCDADTREILSGPMLHHENGRDYAAYPANSARIMQCVANSHTWTEAEKQRCEREMPNMKIEINGFPRTRACILAPDGQNFVLPEPARAIGKYFAKQEAWITQREAHVAEVEAEIAQLEPLITLGSLLRGFAGEVSEKENIENAEKIAKDVHKIVENKKKRMENAKAEIEFYKYVVGTFPEIHSKPEIFVCDLTRHLQRNIAFIVGSDRYIVEGTRLSIQELKPRQCLHSDCTVAVHVHKASRKRPREEEILDSECVVCDGPVDCITLCPNRCKSFCSKCVEEVLRRKYEDRSSGIRSNRCSCGGSFYGYERLP